MPQCASGSGKKIARLMAERAATDRELLSRAAVPAADFLKP